jgi:ABC-type branched-subunit amino acid transport system ATPase component/ABC-type branched-subunit amino acid transport system permease subunit
MITYSDLRATKIIDDIKNNPILLSLAGMIIVFILPFIAHGGWSLSFALHTAGRLSIFAIVIMGLSILFGWAGQLSLGHAGIFAAGAYTAAFVKQAVGEIPLGGFIELGIVLIVAVAIGILLGLPSLRVSGLQLAIITLGFAEVFQWALTKWGNITGAQQGIFVGALNLGLVSTKSSNFVSFIIYLVLATVAGMVMLQLRRTPLGRSLLVIRDSELAAQSIGVSLIHAKLSAFIISSTYACIAGWLFAHHLLAVTPGHFTMFENVYLLMAVVLGGQGLVLGAWLGASYLVLVPELIRGIGGGNLFPIVSGFLLIAIVLFASQGLSAIPKSFLSYNRHKNKKTEIKIFHANIELFENMKFNVEATDDFKKSILKISNVSVRFSGLVALDDISTNFVSGGVNGLIGPNGAGKTTLLNVISGFEKNKLGSVRINDQNIDNLAMHERANAGILRTFQNPRLVESESVFNNVLMGRYRFSKANTISQLLNLKSYRVEDKRDRKYAEYVCNILGIEKNIISRKVSELPYGARKMVEIARVFAAKPDVILLDEPAAGLHKEERDSLSLCLYKYAKENPVIMIITEHDVELVQKICEKLAVLDSGCLIAEGTPENVLKDSIVERAYFGAEGKLSC